MGRVVGIYLRPSARNPVRSVESAEAIVGKGLEGDHAGGGNRQVTLIEEEKWRAACHDLGHKLSDGTRRANVVVERLSLSKSIGGRLRLGEVMIHVIGETRPCRLMDAAAEGLQEALSPDCRGGVYGKVVEGGVVSIGTSVELVEHKEEEPCESRL